MPSKHLILCHPLLLLPKILPSIWVFSNESTLHIRWPKYCSFSISPSNEYQGLFPLGLTVLISLQSKGLSRVFSSTTVQKHQFFSTQPSLWSNSGKVMSLLFDTLSRFVIDFLLRSKYVLTPWLQSLSTVILEPKKIKYVTASTFSPSICHEVMGPDAMILVFWVLSFKPAFCHQPARQLCFFLFNVFAFYFFFSPFVNWLRLSLQC